jgi:hypothetical protein
MKYMKLDKEWFLGSVFGMNMCDYVDFLDEALCRKSRCREYSEEWFKEDIAVQRHMARWDMARLALQSFYGMHYNFTRTAEYYGICNDDESDWLYKVERDKLKQQEGSRETT